MNRVVLGLLGVLLTVPACSARDQPEADGIDAGTDADTDVDADSDTDTDTGSDADTDTDSDTDDDTDTGSDSDTDTDTDTDSDTDDDTDTGSDEDTDSDTGTECTEDASLLCDGGDIWSHDPCDDELALVEDCGDAGVCGDHPDGGITCCAAEVSFVCGPKEEWDTDTDTTDWVPLDTGVYSVDSCGQTHLFETCTDPGPNDAGPVCDEIFSPEPVCLNCHTWEDVTCPDVGSWDDDLSGCDFCQGDAGLPVEGCGDYCSAWGDPTCPDGGTQCVAPSDWSSGGRCLPPSGRLCETNADCDGLPPIDTTCAVGCYDWLCNGAQCHAHCWG